MSAQPPRAVRLQRLQHCLGPEFPGKDDVDVRQANVERANRQRTCRGRLGERSFEYLAMLRLDLKRLAGCHEAALEISAEVVAIEGDMMTVNRSPGVPMEPRTVGSKG
jgi:hypothetical protein